MSHENCRGFSFGRGVLFAVFIWGLLAGQSIAQQGPQVEFENLKENKSDIYFTYSLIRGPEEKRIQADNFRNYGLVVGLPSDFPYYVYYQYEEPTLMTESKEACSLFLYIRPKASAPPTEDAYVVWSYQYGFWVQGQFMDGPYDLEVKVRQAGVDQSGRMSLVAHQKCSMSVLEVSPYSPQTISLSGGTIDLGIKNACRCMVKIQEVRLNPRSGIYWKSKPNNDEKFPPHPIEISPNSTHTLQIPLIPDKSNALKKSLIPPGKEKSHTQVDLEIEVKVGNGPMAVIPKTLDINFSPTLSWLLASSLFGAALAFLVGTALADETPGKTRPGLKKRRLPEVLKKAVFTVVIGLVVYVMYYLLRDNTNIAVFGFQLNPEQVLPAVMIGFIVGLDPLAWYEKLKTIFNKQKGSMGGAMAPAPIAPEPKKKPAKSRARKLRLAIVGALLSSTLVQAGGVLFRPIMLTYHSSSNKLFTVSRSSTWAVDSVYRLDPASIQEPELLGELPPMGIATDHCLVERQSGIWMATVSSLQVASERGWAGSTMRSISLVPLDKGAGPKEGVLKKQDKGIGLYFAVTYDAHQDRLLLSDPVRQAVYAVKILQGKLSDEELVYKDSRWQKPACLIWSDDKLFMADAGTCEVYKIDLATHEMSVVATDVRNPTALAISSDGRLLYAGDADRGVVFEVNLMTGARRERIRHPELITPNGVALDSQGNIWVADSKAMALLQFASDGRLVKTVRPQVAP